MTCEKKQGWRVQVFFHSAVGKMKLVAMVCFVTPKGNEVTATYLKSPHSHFLHLGAGF